MANNECSFFFIPLLAILCFDFLWSVDGLENGLARTPPMGWMAYERFRCLKDCKTFPRDCISESLFMRTADLLVSEGYAALGYEYVIVDDCWMENQRDALTQKLVANRERFPSGIKMLSNYIHDKGLKFGLYHDIGDFTCTHEGPGANGHFTLDAETFADWGVDYVKLDGCFVRNINLDIAYPGFGRALNKTQRPMVYSCSWPYYQKHPNFQLIKTHCNLWRFADDVRDSYVSVIHILQKYYTNQEVYSKFGGPGSWNDPDMLMLGNFILNYEASRLQLAMWAMLAAPLIMSNDLETVRPEIKALLQNRDIIEVDQDPLGISGEKKLYTQVFQAWVRPIMPINNIGFHSFAVAFIFIGQFLPCPLCPQTFEVVLKSLGLENEMGYTVKDLFNSSHSLGLYKAMDTFTTRVNPQGVTFYKFTAVDVN